MSWIERINNNKLIIITGDGKKWYPLWRNAKKQVEFNSKIYNFVGVAGSYVDKTTKIGDKYPFEIWFQGEDCIEQAQSFLKSAEDKNYWTIKHPLYDDFICQAISLSLDNQTMNVSKITGVLYETLTQDFPKKTANISYDLNQKKIQSDTNIIDDFPKQIQFESVQNAKDSISIIDSNYSKLILTNEEISKYKDLLRKASASASNIINDANSFISNVVDLINFPIIIADNIFNKVKSFMNNIISLSELFITDKSSDDDLYMFSSMSNCNLTASCISTVESKDFITSEQVVDTMAVISEAYNKMISDIENKQFIENNDVALSTDIIVNQTLGNLQSIALQAKQKRQFFLEKDNNIINVVNKLYGFSDENLQKFKEQNNIIFKEIFALKKGRNIIYYK